MYYYRCCSIISQDREVGAINEAHETMVWSLAWHPMGHILVSGSNDHSRYKCCIYLDVNLNMKKYKFSAKISIILSGSNYHPSNSLKVHDLNCYSLGWVGVCCSFVLK